MKSSLTCYLCDRRATSREHVPPRCLFPQLKDLPVGFDFRKNLVSVPSCDQHNMEKAADDEFLLFVLSTQARGSVHKQRHFETKVIRAFDRSPERVLDVMDDLAPIVVVDPSGRAFETARYSVDLARFDRCFWHIACGLYFHHRGEKWLGGYRVFTNAFMSLTGPKAEETNRAMAEGARRIEVAFRGYPTHGANPQIFNYKLASTDKGQHAVHLVFYEGVHVSVMLSNT